MVKEAERAKIPRPRSKSAGKGGASAGGKKERPMWLELEGIKYFKKVGKMHLVYCTKFIKGSCNNKEKYKECLYTHYAKEQKKEADEKLKRAP